MKRKLLSLLLAVTMVVSVFNTAAVAEPIKDLAKEKTETACEICGHEHNEACGYIAPESPCTHIHDENCGFTAGTEGVPCSHEHTDDCYRPIADCIHIHTDECYPAGPSAEPAPSGVAESAPQEDPAEEPSCQSEPTACTHICSEESGCITKELACPHEHDENCGYAAFAEGVSCNHEHTAECGYAEATVGAPCRHECLSKRAAAPEPSVVPEVYTLKILYCFKESNRMLAAPYIAELPKDSEYQVNSPEIVGFQLADESQDTVAGQLSGDTSIVVNYAYSTNTASYKVNYYAMDNGTDKPRLLDSYDGNGLIDCKINAEDRTFDGYQRMAADMTLQITADGKAEKNLYYSQNTDPYVIFNTGSAYIAPIKAPAGTDISAQAGAITAPKMKGYSFAGWSQEIPTVMPEKDLILEAQWTPTTSEYYVLYWLENANDDGYTLFKNDEKRTGTTGILATASEADKAKAETIDGTEPFYGFNYGYCDDVTIGGDGHSVLNIYYKRETWQIVLFEEDNSTVWKTIEGKYFSYVPKDFPTEQELRAHYNSLHENKTTEYAGCSDFPDNPSTTALFEKFDSENAGKGSKIRNAYPYFSSNVYAINIEYMRETLDGKDYVQDGTTLQFTANRPANTAFRQFPFEGFTWKDGYWKRGGTKELCEESAPVLIDNSKISTEGASAGSYVFIRINSYAQLYMNRIKSTLQYNSNGENLKILNNVPYDMDLDLSFIPTNGEPNMEFAGWYLSPELFDLTAPLTSHQMPPNDITLYAKWVRNDVTVTFESNGGTEVPSQTFMRGKQAVKPEDPVSDNRIFGGWYTSDGSRWVFDQEVHDDVTLYARWEATPKADYTVNHINRNNNTYIRQDFGEGRVGDIHLASALAVDDTQYGDGIYMEPDAVTKSLVLESTGPNVVDFYYAKGGVKDYKVSYLHQDTGEKLKEDKIVTGTRLSTVTEFAPQIDGYTANEGYRVSALYMGAENQIIFYYRDTDTEPIPTAYTVTYLPNGGSGILVDDQSPYEKDAIVTVLENSFTYTDKSFKEWNTRADGNGTSYQSGSTFAMPDENVVLYAIWNSEDVTDPNPTETPNPTMAPDPTAVPDPTATPNPTAVPDPTATPNPTAVPNPTATPGSTPIPGSATPPTDSPQTGDHSMNGLWWLLAASSFLVGATALILGKKKKGFKHIKK